MVFDTQNISEENLAFDQEIQSCITKGYQIPFKILKISFLLLHETCLYQA